MEDVEVLHGDTSQTPFGLGTYGSRSASVGGSALVMGARKVVDKMTKIAAHLLETAEEDIVHDKDTGNFHVKGSPDQAKAFVEVSVAALTADIPEGMEPSLEESCFYDPANFTFPNSAHIAMIESERETGEVSVLEYAAVDDVGNVINPMIVEGQILGGIAQGVGQALWENGVYDDDGQLLSGSFMDYAMPRADGFPTLNVARTETPSPHNPLGVKGAGEMGTIASTVTVANGVMDALEPFGVRHLNMPHTAEQLWTAMNSNGNGSH